MSRVKMSRPQKAYLNAEAAVRAAEYKMAEAERRHLIQKGITNPDGSVPEQIYQIEDGETFNTINETFEDVPAHRDTHSSGALFIIRVVDTSLVYQSQIFKNRYTVTVLSFA